MRRSLPGAAENRSAARLTRSCTRALLAHTLRWRYAARWAPAIKRVPNREAGRGGGCWQPLPWGSVPLLTLGLVGVRKTFGHDGRSRGDDQGDGDDELLHEDSPSSIGRFDLGSTGWPNLPSEREIIGPSAPNFPIALGYGLGALRVHCCGAHHACLMWNLCKRVTLSL
jgi:hypothetical protein